MAKEILKLSVVEENGEYRITVAGEKAGELVERFSAGCCCCSRIAVKCECAE